MKNNEIKIKNGVAYMSEASYRELKTKGLIFDSPVDGELFMYKGYMNSVSKTL